MRVNFGESFVLHPNESKVEPMGFCDEDVTMNPLSWGTNYQIHIHSQREGRQCLMSRLPDEPLSYSNSKRTIQLSLFL